MSAEETGTNADSIERIIKEGLADGSITPAQAYTARSSLQAYAQKAAAFQTAIVKECFPAIQESQRELVRVSRGLEEIWESASATGDQDYLNSARDSVIDTSVDMANLAVMYDHMRGFGDPMEAAIEAGSINAGFTTPTRHTFEHNFRSDVIFGGWEAVRAGSIGDLETQAIASTAGGLKGSMGPGPVTFFGDTRGWMGYVITDSIMAGLTNSGSAEEDAAANEQARQQAGKLAAVAPHYLRAFTQQMAGRTTAGSAWTGKVKLSFYNSEGDFDSELWSRTIGDGEEDALTTDAAKAQLGSRRFQNGTYGDAWARLQGTDLGNRVGELGNRGNAALRGLANGWACFHGPATEFVGAYLDFANAMIELGDLNDFLKRIGRFFTPEATGIGLGPIAELIEAGKDLGAMMSMDRQKGIFNEQCFLLSYIGEISAYKKARDQNVTASPNTPGLNKALPTPEKNASLLLDGDPYGFLNRLVQSSASKVFFNMKSDVLSHLQPMIRLYKVEYDEDNEPFETEFVFDSYTKNIEESLRNTRQRGVGVGIKNFDFTYDGSNPFSVKKSIKATLKIFANSMDELLEERTIPGQNPISYVDLALKTKQPTQSNNSCAQDPEARGNILREANLDKLNFRLKAVIGWASPNGRGPWDDMSYLKPATDSEPSRNTLLDGIYNSYVTLNLTPTIHDFDFDEMGRVTFTIKYFAFIEDYYDTPIFNIFAGATMGSPPAEESEENANEQASAGGAPSNITAKQIIRNLRLRYYSRNCGDAEGVVDSMRETLVKEANLEKQTALQKPISALRKNSKLYHINLPFQEVQMFNSLGPFHPWDPGRELGINTDSENSDAVTEEMEEAFSSYNFEAEGDEASAQKVFQASLQADSPTNYALSYFYVSDLLDTILELMGAEIDELPTILSESLKVYDDVTECQKTSEVDKIERAKQNFKRLRILLGPVEFVNQGKRGDDALGGTSKFVNFGDIPISVRYFIEWLTAQMFKKDQTTYTLTTFLNDLFNKLVRDFLNNETCFDWNIKQKVRVNQSVITSYPAGGEDDEITQLLKAKNKFRGVMSELKQSGAPILNTSGPGPEGSDGFREFSANPIASLPASQEMNYFVYFAGRTAPRELMKGNKEEDEAKGIFHYMLGRDRGLIKTIKLTKTDSRGLAEVRFEQDGYDGLKQLRVVYDVQIDSFADVKTYPGTYLFVDPRGFAPNTNLGNDDKFNLTQYGLGGYYMIVKSEHNFGAGTANSTIYAKWVNSMEVTAEEQADVQNNSGNTTIPTRCSAVPVTEDDPLNPGDSL